MADLFERMRQNLGVAPKEENEWVNETYGDDYHDPYDDEDDDNIKQEMMDGATLMKEIKLLRDKDPEVYNNIYNTAKGKTKFNDDFLAYFTDDAMFEKLLKMRAKDKEHFYSIIRRYEYFLNLAGMTFGHRFIVFLEVESFPKPPNKSV